jgi:hypothetical protein
MLYIPGHKGNANQNHTLRFHLTPVRMAIMKNTTKKCWQGGKGKSNCLWECKLVQPLRRTVWRLLKRLKVDLPYDPAIPLLGINSKECKLRLQ